MKELIEELEIVLTIDGRGRPKKALFLLELISRYGIEAVIQEVEKISKRKTF